jgi:hypothetical protein
VNNSFDHSHMAATWLLTPLIHGCIIQFIGLGRWYQQQSIPTFLRFSLVAWNVIHEFPPCTVYARIQLHPYALISMPCAFPVLAWFLRASETYVRMHIHFTRACNLNSNSTITSTFDLSYFEITSQRASTWLTA